MESLELAKLIATALDEKKATNIEIVDVRDRTPLSDYYVFATASNVRQLNALKEIVNETVESHGEHVHHIEGKEISGWILIDCYHVIVNVFTESERNRIDLETLLTKY